MDGTDTLKRQVVGVQRGAESHRIKKANGVKWLQMTRVRGWVRADWCARFVIERIMYSELAVIAHKL